ncbi:MAG TPA: hypothetical protein VE967_16810, partial [Gemmatimonadaceae bacterium]|nr:hypothetical protein [Gemmatimonadaceae bacterium]
VYTVVLVDSANGPVLERLVTLYRDGADSAEARKKRDPALKAQADSDEALVDHGGRDGAQRMLMLRLGKIAGELVADLSDYPSSNKGLLRDLSIPAHWFWRVRFDNADLVLTPLSDEWLMAKVDSHKVKLARDSIDGDHYLLSARAPDLQRMVATALRDTSAFRRNASVTLRRAR